MESDLHNRGWLMLWGTDLHMGIVVAASRVQLNDKYIQAVCQVT
jgi:hypothetical protein